MKRLFYLLPAIVAVVLMAACNKTPVPTDPQGGNESGINNGVNYFRGPAYLGDITSFDDEMTEAIQSFFPLGVGMDDAVVCFVGESDIKAKSPALLKAIANDSFIIFPAYDGVVEDFAALGVDLDIASSEGGEYIPLLYCYCGFGQGYTYTMWSEAELEEPSDDGESSWDEAEWNALVEANKQYAGEQEEEEEYEDDYLSYFESRLSAFVAWLEDAILEQAATKSAYVSEMKGELENLAKRYPASFSYSLYEKIDKATGSDPDYLSGYGSVDVDIRVFPVFKQSSNDNQAGDYYIIVSRITPHNSRMWNPRANNHGLCQNRLYGFWFDEMNVTTSLVNTNGSVIDAIDYFERPIPENKNQSMQYSNGKSITLGGSLNAGVGDVAGKSFGGGLSFGATWSSSTSYALNTIEYTVDSSSPSAVKYRYYTTENVTLTDSWGKQSKIDKNFPPAVRNDFYANSNWVWHVGSVKDDDTKTSFKLETAIDITYASWYHWRLAQEYDSNKKTYTKHMPKASWKLAAPNRVSWGVIALKNASTYEMAHVTVYDKNNKVVDVLSNSFSKDQVAKVSLPVGEYSIKYDLMDGTTQRKYASYVYNNIAVHQGGNETAATVEISTIDGVKQ